MRLHATSNTMPNAVYLCLRHRFIWFQKSTKTHFERDERENERKG
jgi:hypothetical protein